MQPEPTNAPDSSDGQARRLANLRSPWKPGESGNAAGRPRAGASVREQINALQDATGDELAGIVADDTKPAHRRAAARVWLLAIAEDTTARHRLDALKTIIDYSDGRPHQTVTVEQRAPLLAPDEEAAELLREMRRGDLTPRDDS